MLSLATIRITPHIVAALGAAAIFWATPAQADCYNTMSKRWCPIRMNHSTYVTVRDYSSKRWPVTRALNRWNYPASYSNSLYLYKTRKSSARIKVYSGEYGWTDWSGLAYRHWKGSCLSLSRIYLNDTNTTTSTGRAHVAGHEVGHAIGLNHVASCSPLMNGEVCGYRSNPNGVVTSCDAKGARHLYP